MLFSTAFLQLMLIRREALGWAVQPFAGASVVHMPTLRSAMELAYGFGQQPNQDCAPQKVVCSGASRQ